MPATHRQFTQRIIDRAPATALTLALAVATFVGPRPAAWAVCADGSTFPAGGYVAGQPPLVDWMPSVFTATLNSFFVPDASTFEHNDPTQPLTGGGHSWVFDQGHYPAKMADVGPAGGAPTSWAFPDINAGQLDTIVLPCIVNGVVTCIGDVPGTSDVITPTCDPTKLSAAGAPNPANTYFNQLGCSISHGVATTPQTATTYLFVAGVKSGLLSIPLKNISTFTNFVNVASYAGKVAAAGENYYSAIPEGQKLTAAAVSSDGQFAIATSRFNLNSVYACLNPLGDPGDPRLPIDPNFAVPLGSKVLCMQVGNNNLKVDALSVFGPDDQPYFLGATVNSFGGSLVGGTANTAWPQCIWKNNGSLSLADAFVHKRQGGCGNAQPSSAFAPVGAIPGTLLRHGQYLYASASNGALVQMKVVKDASGVSHYTSRTYVSGAAPATGVSVADDLGSLMVYTDPSGIGAAAQEVVWKAPLCEDM